MNNIQPLISLHVCYSNLMSLTNGLKAQIQTTNNSKNNYCENKLFTTLSLKQLNEYLSFLGLKQSFQSYCCLAP